MGLPAAVKKQVKEAEAAHDAAYKSSEAAPEKTPAEAQLEVVSEQTAQEAPVQDQTVVESEVQTEKQAPEQTAPEAQPLTQEVDWEHRYKTLQGKYNAEMPRLHQQIRELQAAVNQMQSAPEPEQEAPAPVGVTEKEVEEYGQDFIDVVRRVADAQMAQLRAENAKLKEQVSGMNTNLVKSDRERMMGQLASEVPNWKDINTDDGFLLWLDEVDPYSGRQRLDMLQSAFEANDAPRTIAFFKGYLNENAAITSDPPKPSVAGRVVPKVDAQTLVAPGRVRESGDSRAQEGSAKPRWSTRDVELFYNEVRKGKYKNRPKEQAKIEAQIIEAGREGRIV